MRKFSLAALFAFLVALPAVAQETAKPNTLTPQEAAEGWLLLCDGSTTFGWETEGKVVADGGLILGGKEKAQARRVIGCGSCRISFEYRVEKSDARANHPGVSMLPVLNSSLQFPVGQQGWALAILDYRFDAKKKTCHAEMRFDSQTGQQSSSASRACSLPAGASGAAGLQFLVPAGSTLSLRNIKVRPRELEPLFNGKDLTGWRVFPGRKSKFAVEDGLLRVTNGPGDLQTVGTYGDFLLQLECKVNGKHLNSGIFFRCRPDEYQNGYEAQIRNQFTAQPTQKYVVEQYDPQTHKLLGKKSILSPAVDFGTGAIYRRQPARSQAAKDGAWFTLTVMAHGNHFATWVNGVPQADWIDNRPANSNPRTGYRAAAGHLSIQGHDPTTDLSFRNLRIVEIPAAK